MENIKINEGLQVDKSFYQIFGFSQVDKIIKSVSLTDYAIKCCEVKINFSFINELDSLRFNQLVISQRWRIRTTQQYNFY